ncbi:RNA polymerase sigma-70 factor [Rapidithrix thailandica]|uniref:RNA polymerase sigma-70 factor n=1 Tax=Rapidithrix thailandica TaxID=413964 RepID=A0AAW9S6X2_9BACT
MNEQVYLENIQQIKPTEVKELIKGNKAAFEKIYFEYHQQLYYVALTYVKDPKLAEDVLQDVFLKLWINRHQIDPSLSIKNFLYTTLKNHVLNLLRHKKTTILKHMEIANRQPHNSNETEKQVLLNEYQQAVTQALQQLSDRKREVFQLKTYQGLKNEDVAKKLGISVNTVKVRYTQAVNYLREYLKKNSNLSIPVLILLFHYLK